MSGKVDATVAREPHNPFLCPITLEFMETPVVAVDTGDKPDDDRFVPCRKGHTCSVEGALEWAVEQLLKNPDAKVTCPGSVSVESGGGNVICCPHPMTLLMVNQRMLEDPDYQRALQESRAAEAPEAEVAKEASKAKDVARPILREVATEPERGTKEWFVEKAVEEFKKMNQLHVSMVGQMIKEERGEQSPVDTKKATPNPKGGGKPIPTPKNVAPPSTNDEDKCCLADLGIFNVTLLTGFTLVVAIYAYVKGFMGDTLGHFDGHHREHQSLTVKESSLPSSPYRPETPGMFGAPMSTGGAPAA